MEDIKKLNEKINLPKLLNDVQDLEMKNINLIFSLAKKIKNNNELYKKQPLLGKCIGMIFDEPSSRTYLSFVCAVNKLGGKCIDIKLKNSSMVKGENFEDTLITFQTYVDALIIRVSNNNFFDEIKNLNLLKIPIINAGCGNKSHPTQGLLDLFTMQEEIGEINGKEISLVGDLSNSRTIKSLLHLLKNFDVKLNLVPYSDKMRLDRELVIELENKRIVYNYYEILDDIIQQSDIIYMTRLQKERGSQGLVFILDKQILNQGKEELIIMHPLPRNREINQDIDNDKRAVYFKQMKYGFWVRMAILYHYLS